MSAKKTISELQTSGTWRQMTKAQQAERIVEERFGDCGPSGLPEIPLGVKPIIHASKPHKPPFSRMTTLSDADFRAYDQVRWWLIRGGIACVKDHPAILAIVKANNVGDLPMRNAIENMFRARPQNEQMKQDCVDRAATVEWFWEDDRKIETLLFAEQENRRL